MELQRDGIVMDQQTYIQTAPAMRKTQQIAASLTKNNPDLAKYLGPDSALKPNRPIPISITQKDQKRQTTTLPAIISKDQSSAKDCVARAEELQKLLIEQRKKNEELNKELEQRKERFVQRQITYREIISGLEVELKNKAVLDIGETRSMDNLIGLHSQINENISSLQSQTTQILIDQEKEIIHYFNNYINDIQKQFEDERIKKGKKDAEYITQQNQLISELEWIQNIAQKIDNENHNLMKQYMDLKAQYQTQQNDREMLLKELIMKKKKNAILKNQMEQYQQLLDDVTQNEEDNEDNDDGASETSLQQQMYGSIDSPDKSRPVSRGKPGKIVKTSQDLGHSYLNKGVDKKNMSSMKLSNRDTMGFANEASANQDREKNAIKSLQSNLQREQRRVRQLQNMYMKELESKTELEKILRKCVDDLKEEIIQIKGENRVGYKGRKGQELGQQYRDQLIEKLLNNERILTLVYDKTFYPDLKNIDMTLSNDFASKRDNIEELEKELQDMN